ncbi:MAG: hypothetical protein WC505_00195 [Patescibacteria group bacterium]
MADVVQIADQQLERPEDLGQKVIAIIAECSKPGRSIKTAFGPVGQLLKQHPDQADLILRTAFPRW